MKYFIFFKVKEELDKKFKKGKSKKEKEIESKKRNPDEETPKKGKKSKDEPSSALKIKVGSAKKVKKEENSSDEDFELTLPGTTNEPPVEENDSEDPKGSKGQLISKCPSVVFKSPPKPTIFFPGFLPQTLKRGQIKKIRVRYMVNWRIVI